jgi:hypothetical protein
MSIAGMGFGSKKKFQIKVDIRFQKELAKLLNLLQDSLQKQLKIWRYRILYSWEKLHFMYAKSFMKRAIYP